MTDIDLLSTYLDATYLSLEDSLEQQQNKVELLCNEVITQNLRGVCVRDNWVETCKSLLKNTSYEIASVIAFPMKKSTIQEQKKTPSFGVVSVIDKVKVIESVFQKGATEVDVVLNTSYYLLPVTQMKTAIFTEVSALQGACAGKRLKLILECDLFPVEKLPAVVESCLDAGVDCLKNATGYITDGKGATDELIQQMRHLINLKSSQTLLKASAGIKTQAQAIRLIRLGANIIGTSSAESILNSHSTNSCAAY